MTEARAVGRSLEAFPTHYPQHILEQATIAGALLAEALAAQPQALADSVAARLDLIAAEYERGWEGRPTQDGGLRLARVLRGVEEVRRLDGQVLRSGEARRLATHTQSLPRGLRPTRRIWCAVTASRRSMARWTC